MSQNANFKIGDLVKMPDSSKIAKVIHVDDNGKVLSVEMDGKIIDVIDQVIEKVSLIVKILSFFRSLFKI